MQNRKRITSLFVVLTLLISMFTTFAVSADTADEAVTTEETVIETLEQAQDVSVERTHAFGILSDSDLSLDANESVTRAEFVAMAVKMLNMENLDGSFRYNDVPDDYWAAKYINTACGLNLVSKADEFNPDAKIQFSEAVKILVNAAGYEVAAQANGGYPGGYVTMAARAGILDNVLNKSGEVTRLDAVKMVDNTIDTYIMDTNYAGEYSTTSKTILSEYLKIDKKSVQIMEVDKINNKMKVLLNGVEKWYDIANTIDAALVVEDEADIYISSDRYKDVVIFIDFKGTITVSYDYIAEVNESSSFASYSTADIEEIYLKNEGKSYKMDSGAVVTVNDANLDDLSASLVGVFAKVVKRDEKVYKIEAYTLYEGGVLNKADVEKIKYAHGEVNDNAMEGLDKIEDLQIYLDGVPTSDIYQLKSNYVFDYYISADEKKLILVASSRVLNKKLTGTSNDGLIFDGEEFEINQQYGLYVYSNTRERYQKDASLDTYMGKNVTVMVDDNMCVRYLKITDDAENVNSFYGIVTGVSKNINPFDDEVDIKVYKITGGQGEKTYRTDTKKMAKSPIKVDYIRSVAGDTEGKSFLKFTLSKEDKISKVEEIDNWGNKFTFTDSISKTNTGEINNINCTTSEIFAVFHENGECKVKVLDWKKDLINSTFPGGVTVVTDYNPMYNPRPDFVMFGTGSENHRTSGAQTGFVKSVTELADDKVQLKFLQPYGTDTYVVTKDFYNANAAALKINNMVDWYYQKFTEDPIEIKSYRDFSGPTSTWANNNDTYTSGTNNGFYKADKIMYRDGSSIQFMINGEPSDLIPLNTYSSIYEVVHNKNGNDIVRKTGNNVLGYINPKDNVWVLVTSWGPSPRSAIYVIYEKTSITGD